LFDEELLLVDEEWLPKSRGDLLKFR